MHGNSLIFPPLHKKLFFPESSESMVVYAMNCPLYIIILYPNAGTSGGHGRQEVACTNWLSVIIALSSLPQCFAMEPLPGGGIWE